MQDGMVSDPAPAAPLHPTSVRPGDFLRLQSGSQKAFYKIVVNRSGIRLHRAKKLEVLGALLGANMSHRVKQDTKILMLGMHFVAQFDADTGLPSMVQVDA